MSLSDYQIISVAAKILELEFASFGAFISMSNKSNDKAK